MISKEQAISISEQLILDSRPSEKPIPKLLRRRQFIVLAAMLPIFIIALSHPNTKPFSFYVIFSFLLILAAVVVYHQYRTPIMEIDDINFTYFGYWPAGKKVTPIKDITKVIFFSKLRFWSSCRTLTIYLESSEIQILLPNDNQYSAYQLRKFLSSNFGDKFFEKTS